MSRYHFSPISTLCKKLTKLPKSCFIDCDLLSAHLNSYQGAKNLTKQEKGFHYIDISFYQALKECVIKECKLMKKGQSNNNIVLNSLTPNKSSVPFTFDYPHSSIHVKVEGSSSRSKNKKRKLTSDFDHPEVSNEPVEALAMSLDDDGFIAV